MRQLAFVTLLCLFGCGPVIGDPCTVATECGPGVCLNRDFAPGGLCTRACTMGQANTCPAGSTCVEAVIDADTPGCLLNCARDADCRSGYSCRSEGEGGLRPHGIVSACLGPGQL